MTDDGKLKQIENLRDLPLRMAEGILEGMASKPADFMVLGMGFFAGYMGYDLMTYMMRPFQEALGAMGKGIGELPSKVACMTFPLADMPIEVGAGLGLGTVDKLTGIFPGKHITPATKGQITAPGVSYYGPPPKDYQGDWPPHGITLAQIQAEIEKDNDKRPLWEFELLTAETELKLVCGCLSALAAYALTRPGTIHGILQGIGSITEGFGEVVPF